MTDFDAFYRFVQQSGDAAAPGSTPAQASATADAEAAAGAPQPQPAAPAPRSQEHHGTVLRGSSLAFSTTGAGCSSAPQPPCTPITLYSTDFTYQHGNLIAINENYISYAIKNGKIRVLNQVSATRTLLRGHTGAITDLVFFSRQTNLLASVCTDGLLFVWQITEAEGSQEFTHEIVHQANLAEAAQRVVWHPWKPMHVALACGASVVLQTFDGPPPSHARRECLGHTDVINDLIFTPNGHHLATVSNDGSLKLWDVGDMTVPPECVVNLIPHDGAAVTRVLFLDAVDVPSAAASSAADLSVLTGGLGNSQVKLWEPLLTETPRLLQQLAVHGDEGDAAPQLQLLLDDTSEFLMMANVNRNSLFVVHLRPRHEALLGERIDYLTPFTLMHPILSFMTIGAPIVATSHDTDADAEIGGFEVQLFCVQTKAIQEYHLRPTQCYVRPDDEPRDDKPAALSGDVPAVASATDTSGTDAPAGDEAHAAPPRHVEERDNESTESKLSVSVSQEEQAAGMLTAEEKEPSAYAAGPLSPVSPVLATSMLPLSGEPTSSSNDHSYASATSMTVTPAARASASESAVLDAPSGAPNVDNNDVAAAAAGALSDTLPNTTAAANEASATGGDDAASVSAVAESRSSTSSVSANVAAETAVRGAAAATRTSPQAELGEPLTLPLQQIEASFSRLLEEHLADHSRSIATQLATLNLSAASVGSTAHDETGASLSALEVQIQTTLKNELQSTVVPAMARIVIHTMETNFLKPVKLELQKLVTAQLMPRLEKLVKSSVTAQLTTLVPALGQQISADLHDLVSIDKIRGPVTESFRQCFQEMLIPAFQAATQKMFLQIDQTFQKGLEARKPDQAADQNAAALAQLTQQLAQVTQSLGQLSLQVAQLQASMASMPAATVPPAAPETQESSDPLAEIEDLLREQKIEEAMMKALGKQDLKVLTWLCGRINPKTIFSVTPPMLSQMVLLCLMQQLGSDLANGMGLKLEWLREIALNLNPKDPEIESHVPEVLRALKTSMEQAYPAVAQEGSNASDFKLLMHVVTSLLSH